MSVFYSREYVFIEGLEHTKELNFPLSRKTPKLKKTNDSVLVFIRETWEKWVNRHLAEWSVTASLEPSVPPHYHVSIAPHGVSESVTFLPLTKY